MLMMSFFNSLNLIGNSFLLPPYAFRLPPILMQSSVPLFPEQASTNAARVDTLYIFLILVTLFFTLLVSGLVVYFAIKYRRRSESDRPPETKPNIFLEVAWIVIPLAIELVIFVWGANIYFSLAKMPADAIDINVVAKQWMWKTQHMEGQREINELHVPVGKAVRLTMTSEDVIHSFFVPAFRIKADVLPGAYAKTWFQATKPGRYHLFCAEYCGARHSGMIGEVIVMEPAQYEAWLASGGEGSLASKGQKLFLDLGCASCHRSDSTARAPMLTELFGKPVQLNDGRIVIADENYIRESILNPTAKVVDGFDAIMPTFQGVVSEEDIMELIAYIKSIRADQSILTPAVSPAAASPPTSQKPTPPNSQSLKQSNSAPVGR